MRRRRKTGGAFWSLAGCRAGSFAARGATVSHGGQRSCPPYRRSRCDRIPGCDPVERHPTFGADRRSRALLVSAHSFRVARGAGDAAMYRRTSTLVWSCLLIAGAGTALAQSGGDFAITRRVVAGGGSAASGGDFAAVAT